MVPGPSPGADERPPYGQRCDPKRETHTSARLARFAEALHGEFEQAAKTFKDLFA